MCGGVRVAVVAPVGCEVREQLARLRPCRFVKPLGFGTPCIVGDRLENGHAILVEKVKRCQPIAAAGT